MDVTKLEICSKRKRAETTKRSRFSEEQVIGILREAQAGSPLEAAIARYGAPEHIRSDNGPEFIAYAI